MSSEDEEGEEPTSPALHRDSDRASSVSSELQDEYEELLRYAVVTPKMPSPTGGTHSQRPGTSRAPAADGRRDHQRKEDHKSQRPADTFTEAKDARQSTLRMRPSLASPTIVEPASQSRASHAEETEGLSTGRVSDRLQVATARSRPSSTEPPATTETEICISEENLNQMENILDTWSGNLKSHVLNELRKWKLIFMEQQKLEMRKEKERFDACTSGLRAELDVLQAMLHTYETSNRRKDEVIMNLSQVLDRQKEKHEKMRTFSHWRLQHREAKEEAAAALVAQQHYELQLKRKVWLSWHSLIQKHWKVKVEQACRARAEEVCACLSAEYEAKLAEHCETIHAAQVEIQRLRLEREHYEESMKKAFMRGVCALNMEALSMFHTAEPRPEQHPPAPDQQGL